MRNQRAGSRQRRRGQSLVEFAVTAPVIIFLLMGSVDLGVFISDLQVAVASVREGARLASVLGGQNCVIPPLSSAYPDSAYVDDAIVKNTLTIAQRLNFGVVTNIYIYGPQAANGVFNPGTDQYSKYSATGSRISSNFDLADRIQTAPNETPIGVELDWSYGPIGSGTVYLASLKHYAVFRAMAVPTGC